MDVAALPSIDVIVPVRGAGAAFRRCAASLIRHLDPARHRLIIVLDGPPDAETIAAVRDLDAAFAHADAVTVLRQPEPLGFVKSVNRAMRGSERDVVLLNSDTQVTAGWLDRLGAAAASDAAIATVTPSSNNATICSLPRFLDENTVPAGCDIDTFAAVIAQVSRCEYPRLPTGVGACLYIKRRVLDEIGLFDESFGLGYGEEIDFCLKASRRGYVHVLDDASYVFHEGSRSFGRSRARRVARAEGVIRSRYPTFRGELAEFIRRDPLAGIRARVIAAIQPTAVVPVALVAPVAPAASVARAARARRRITHLVHGWPPWSHGGTEMYAWWLARHQRETGDDVFVYARIADPDRLLGDAIEHLDHGVRVRLIVNNFAQRNPLSRLGLHCGRIARDFRSLLDEIRPDLLHVHHLVGHCASLIGLAQARRIPIVYQVQDWWPLCARANLIDRHEALCTGPAPIKCARCLPMTPRPVRVVSDPLLYAARQRWIRTQVRKADAFVMGSRFIADSYTQAGVLSLGASMHVLPYGVPNDTDTNTNAPDLDIANEAGRSLHAPHAQHPLRFGYIGSLHPHKGVHLAIDAFTQIDPRHAQLHVWGEGDNAAYRDRLVAAARATPAVQLHGGFPESEKAAIFKTVDVLIVPSIGLESFGLVAREAMAHGVPVLASRRGALGELSGGDFFEAGDAAAIARWVTRLIAEPELIAQWRQALPPIKSIEQHAAEIDRVYADVIQSRPLS